MSLILGNTLKNIFDNNKTAYLIIDIHTKNLLNRFFNLDELVLNGIIGIFDISTMIVDDKELTEKSKNVLCNNNMIYMIETTDKNLVYIEKQLVHFNNDVRIVFLSSPTETILSKIAKMKNANLISLIQSVPFDIQMFSDLVIMTNSLPEIFNKGYHILPTTYIDNEFNKSLKQKTQNILEQTTGKYKTLIISVPRSIDMITPYLVPWTYRSMIAYYMKISYDVVYDGNNILFSTNVDKYFKKWKNLQFDKVTDEINSTMKILKDKSDSLHKILNSHDTKQNIAYEMIENNRDLNILKKHIRCLEIINTNISEYQSIKLSELQIAILNSMKSDEFNEELSKFATNYKHDLLNSKPFRDLITLAYILNIRTKYEQYIDQYVLSFMQNNKVLSVHEFIKLPYIDVKGISTSSKDALTDIMSDVKTMTKSIANTTKITLNVAKETNQSTVSKHDSKSDLKTDSKNDPRVNVNISSKGLSLCDRNADNVLLSHIPMISVICDAILNKKNSSVKLNPQFIDIFNSNKFDTSNLFSQLETIILHIDSFTTYEEVRVMEHFIKKYNLNNTNPVKLELFLHSEMIK